MELDREQIVKALECCTSPDGDSNCSLLCPCGDINLCTQSLMAHALALIKELTEENEKLRAELASRPPKLIITKRR